MFHARNQHTQASIWTQEPVLTPERKFWRAVLEQAYVDAEMPLFPDGSESLERILARRFLRADSAYEAQGLELVCEFADVPPDRVYLWARRNYPLKNARPNVALPAFASALSQEQQPGCAAPQIPSSRQAMAQA